MEFCYECYLKLKNLDENFKLFQTKLKYYKKYDTDVLE